MRTVFLTLLLGTINVMAQDIPQTGIGYRGDGSSIFPTAKPPVKWDDDTNIRWKVPLHNWTYCSPTPVGDRVYVTCEPSSTHPFPRLVCYSTTDGKELWQAEINVLDAHPQVDEATRTQVRADLSDIYGRIEKIYEICQVIDKDSRIGKDHPTLIAVNKELAKVNATLDDYRKGYGLLRTLKMLDSEAWKARIGNITKSYGYPVLPCWWNFSQAQIGHAFQTPVANNDAVFVIIRGCAAAFSHEGKLLWSHNLPTGPRASTGSPRLYKDKLLVEYASEFTCLDTKTGKVLYTMPVKNPGNPFGNGDAKTFNGRANASPQVFTLNGTDLVLVTTGRIIRIADGKLFDAHLPHIFLNAAIDESTGRVWGQKVSDGGGVGWCGRLSLEGDDLKVELLKAGSNKKDPFRPGAQAIFYKDRLITAGYQRDPEHGNVFGKAADYKIVTKGKQVTPRTAPNTRHILLIANGHVYGLKELGGKYAEKRTGKAITAGVCEVYTVDGKHVATNYLSAGPWDSKQKQRLVRTDFKESFSYSCGFNIGPDCLYMVTQDYLFCIGE